MKIKASLQRKASQSDRGISLAGCHLPRNYIRCDRHAAHGDTFYQQARRIKPQLRDQTSFKGLVSLHASEQAGFEVR